MSASKEISPAVIKDIYIRMLTMRLFEEKIVELYPKQEMRTPVHLYIGEEAVGAGVCAALEKRDYVFTTHRSHGVYIAKGGDLTALAAELYGRRTGCSAGKGGSMHIVDTSAGVCGTTAIVGGSIPLATGGALASSVRGSDEVSCAFFGDGAADEGVFYESLNFAALKKLPVLFICENNFFATHSHQAKRQPLDNIFAKAAAFGIIGERIDGNDAIAVYDASHRAVRRARDGEGPTLIECRTYRWKSHVGPETDEDLGFPPKQYLHQWIAKCPVKRMAKYVRSNGVMTVRDEKRAVSSIKTRIDRAFRVARRAPLPTAKDLLTDVYEETVCPGQN